jgi:hypothetical protein
MTASNAIEQTKEMTNGVDVGQIMSLIGAIESDSGYARFQWRATNQWINGGLSRSRIKDFFAGNAEDTTRKQAFTLDADEPTIAAGQNSAPNSMEYVLHALATCLTGTLVYHAAVRGIEIDSVESSYTGDMATWMSAAFSALLTTCARASTKLRSTCVSEARQA